MRDAAGEQDKSQVPVITPDWVWELKALLDGGPAIGKRLEMLRTGRFASRVDWDTTANADPDQTGRVLALKNGLWMHCGGNGWAVFGSEIRVQVTRRE